MTSFDDRLREGLTREDEAFLKDLEDGRGLFTQLGATFQGPLKYWTALGMIFTFVFFGLGVLAVVQLLDAERMNDILLWAALLFVSVLSMSLLKLWFFMRMNHLVQLRELKKIQLALARLTPTGD